MLVRRYQARVASHVTRMVGNRDDALDLAQEIFLKVFQALDRFNPAYKFSTWLFRIAGNAAIDHLRKRRPRTVPLGDARTRRAALAPIPGSSARPGWTPTASCATRSGARRSCARSAICPPISGS